MKAAIQEVEGIPAIDQILLRFSGFIEVGMSQNPRSEQTKAEI